MLKKIWNDPVVSNVIAATIVAVGAIFVTYILDWWPIIGHMARESYNFLLASTPVQNWVFGIVGLLTLPTIFFVFVVIWDKIFLSQSKIPDWQSYTIDQFFGLC
jgi:hypothetical protein